MVRWSIPGTRPSPSKKLDKKLRIHVKICDFFLKEKMQMLQQSQRTTWGTGMNPTGHYAHMFEEWGEKGIYPKQPRSL
jgi:hypothetical protein